MKKGNEITLKIEKTEFPSKGIAHVDGLIVYSKNSFPGQVIRGKVTKKKKDYAEIKPLEIVERAEYEVDAKCPVFGLCGGCSSQSLPYEKQLELKKDEVKELFDMGSMETGEFLGIEGSPNQWEYRNKMEFTFGDQEKGGELTLGMHMKGSPFSIITVDMCKIVHEDFRKIIKYTLEYFREKNLPYYRIMKREGYLRNLVVRRASKTGEIMVNLVTTTQIDFPLDEYLEGLKEISFEGTLASVIHTENNSFSDAVIPEKVNLLFGRDYIMEELLGLKFKISPFSFFQTNTEGAEKLYSLVRDFMGEGETGEGKIVFDLYCGTGTIGQITAPKAKKVVGIELIEEAVAAANENSKLNGLNNCEFIAGDIAKVITEVKDKPDIIILDPPRSGVHPVAMKYVIAFNAKDIIYVSCNPKTLVDDLKALKAAGYKIEKTICKDMFPNTPHCETVVKLYK
ncbi:MAG: 23S rRNA (uracil(1939)-C(5))-methyltransferase RlmD [Clostridiaceae bacterium]